MKSRWAEAAVIALVVVLVAVQVVGCGARAGDGGAAEDELVPVERGSLVSAVTAIGSVVPQTQVPHAFGVGGRVAEVLVEAGDRVEAGETLARLDTAELVLHLESAEAARTVARAQLDQLEAGARPEEVAAARANLTAAEEDLAELTSAAAGLVARVDVTAGQWVAPAAPVIVVIDDGDYRVEVDVDETDIGALQVGQEVLLTLDAFLGRQLTGRVVAIAPTATLDLGIVTYGVTVAIDPTDLPLRVGLTANAEIIRGSRENVLLVPNLAITVAEPGGLKTVTRRTAAGDEQVVIETGLSTDLWSEVLLGLEEGDRVVVSSFSYRDQLQRAMEAYLQGGGRD